MFAPSVEVTLHTGVQVSLNSLYANARLGVFFLRHLGCPFCREQVIALRDRADANVVFVVMASPEDTTEFRAKLHSPQNFICDPAKSLYRAFGLGTGNLTQMFNLHTLSRGTSLAFQGVNAGRVIGDPMALSGAFLVDVDGRILWEHRAKDAADNPQVSQLLDQLTD